MIGHMSDASPPPRAVADAAEAWLSEGPEGLARRSDNARRIGRPNAVFDIAEEIWEQAQRPPIPTNRRNLLRDITELTRQLTSI